MGEAVKSRVYVTANYTPAGWAGYVLAATDE